MASRKSARGSKAPPAPAGESHRFPIACIGASAGGLEAFTRLLKKLPATTGIGFVVIQHLDPTHESALAGLLAKSSPIPVAEARDGMRVKPDRVYVIPPDTVMTLSCGVLRLAPRSSERRYMPIDHFMRSLAEDLKNRAIGVILSGTATDGTLGLEAIEDVTAK